MQQLCSESRKKVQDVMHTLSVVLDGKALNPSLSLRACIEVLEEAKKIQEDANAR